MNRDAGPVNFIDWLAAASLPGGLEKPLQLSDYGYQLLPFRRHVAPPSDAGIAEEFTYGQFKAGPIASLSPFSQHQWNANTSDFRKHRFKLDGIDHHPIRLQCWLIWTRMLETFNGRTHCLVIDIHAPGRPIKPRLRPIFSGDNFDYIPTDGILKGRQDQELAYGQRAMAFNQGAKAQGTEGRFANGIEFVHLFAVHDVLHSG